MAGTSIFQAPAPRQFELTNAEDFEVPTPLSQEEKVKPGLMQRIMPFVMIAMMLLMMVVMFTMRSGSGGGVNPMMFMFPVMMGMSMLMMFANNAGGNDIGELNQNRRDYSYQLRELRKRTHQAGEEVHQVMASMFPNPAILVNYIGQRDPREPIMWQYSESAPGGLTAFEGTVDEVSFKPFMSARMGTGITNLIPNLTFEALSVPERLEPVTMSQFRSFVRTQGFIVNVPIAVNLTTSGAFAFTNDEGVDEKKYGLIRAMLSSLVFNHSPNVLRVAVITDNISDPKWDFMKWLPHALHPSAFDTLGACRMVYRDMDDFVENVPEALREVSADSPRWIVIVDKPYHEITPPQRTSMSAGNGNCTFIVAAARTDRLATSNSARYHLTDEDEIVLPYSEARLHADYLSVDDMDSFCRSMFCWRAPTLSEAGTVTTSTGPFVLRSWFDVLGINDINDWDPRLTWRANETNDELTTPVGLKTTGYYENELTNEVVAINAAESAAGGTGPHGIGQGRTGTGKSVMIAAFVLGLIARYSPEKVAFILMDFKGGSTFKGYDRLPHIVANLSNLEGASDMIDRAYQVIAGEMQRRMELIDEYGTKDIRKYRERRRQDPSMPKLPHLFIVIDEYKAFIDAHRDFQKLLDEVSRLGRSIGIHLFLVSQAMDQSTIGGIKEQIGFGVSLSVSRGTDSREVIGTDDAASLPSGKGDAIVFFREGMGDNPRVRMRTFFTEEIYVPPIKEEVSLDTTSMDDQTVEEEIELPQILPYTVERNDMVIEHDPQDEVDNSAEAELREQRKREAEARAKEDDDDSMQMKMVLIDRIAREEGIEPVMALWQRSMRQPITFNEFPPEVRSDSYPDLTATIGVIDDPYHHAQYPWDIKFSAGATSHLLIAGAHGSGKTVALEAIVASIAQSYPPDAAQFLILASSGKIADVQEYPHVVGYAALSDKDSMERFFGEIEKILDVRTRTMTAWGSADANDYLSRKLREPVPDDPYGHLFFVIDGLGDAIELDKAESSTNMFAGQPLDKQLMTMIGKGTRLGVHFIGTTVGMSQIGYVLPNSLPSKLFLTMDNDSDVDREIRPIIGSLGLDQPGRSAANNMHARVLIPQREEVPVMRYDKGNPLYDAEFNYGPQVSALAHDVAEQYAAQGMKQVSVVKPVSSLIDYEQVWDAVAASIKASGRDDITYQPLGIRTSDSTIVDVSGPNSPSHIIIGGERQSGKTNILRNVINNVVRQRKPKNAKFVVFDPRGELFTESQVLKRNKALLAYSGRADEMDKYWKGVTKILKERQLTSDQMMNLTREERENRSWITGPDIYILIDGLPELERGLGYGATDAPFVQMLEELKQQPDLGCYTFATVRSAEAGAMERGKYCSAVSAAGLGTVVLSGERSDGKLFSVQFEKARPGLATYYDSVRPTKIQVPLSEPWPEA